MKRTLATILLAGAATLSFACGARAHLTEGHGERSTAYFETQRASDEAPDQSPTELDSEEAAILHDAYRQNLGATKATNSENTRVLVVEPDQ